jgi:amidase
LCRNAGYTSVWNSLDYSAAVFPVSTVDPAVDVKKPAHVFLSEADKWAYELCASMSLCTLCYTFFLPLLTASLLDDPDTFKGAPVGLQLVGRTLEEEAVIAMTEIVDAALKELQGSEGTLPHLRASL